MVLHSAPISAQDQYDLWEETRPPRSYSLRIRRKLYPNLNEGALFCLEAKVFYAEEAIPEPPAELTPGHPIVKAFHRFKKENARLFENIDRLHEIKGALRATPDNEGKLSGLINTVRVCIATVQRKNIPVVAMPIGEQQKEFKKTREDYHTHKKRSLQALITYLTLYLRLYPNNLDLQNLREQTEATYLAHQTYSAVKTTIHDNDPMRESGEIVMHHVYDVCVAGINKFMKRIMACTDSEEKARLYHRMKISIVVRLCHDMKEDYKELWNTEVFENLLLAMTRFDSRFLNLLYDEKGLYGEEAKNPHFTRNNWPQIERMVDALTKPSKKTRKPGYLRHKILNNPELSPEEIEDVLDIKNDDRKNNIDDLKYMKEKPESNETPLQRQIRKTEETIEILQMDLDHHEDTGCEQSLDNVIVLADCCLRELKRLEEEFPLEIDHGGAAALKIRFSTFKKTAELKKAA